MIFVDTGAWFASIVPKDVDHLVASQWLSQNNQPLLTTDFVIDETLTLLKVRGEISRVKTLGEAFFRGEIATIYYLTEVDIKETWEVFQKFSDKEWSFTDCSSKVIMEKLGINYAFSFDHHFHQFASVIVLP